MKSKIRKTSSTYFYKQERSRTQIGKKEKKGTKDKIKVIKNEKSAN